MYLITILWTLSRVVDRYYNVGQPLSRKKLTESNKSLREYLRNARKAAKHSQQSLAEAAGISRESVRLYEAGERGPSDENMPTLAESLGVAEDELRAVVEQYRADQEKRLSDRKKLDAAGDAAIVITNPQTGEPWLEFHIELVFRARVVSPLTMDAGLRGAQIKLEYERD